MPRLRSTACSETRARRRSPPADWCATGKHLPSVQATGFDGLHQAFQCVFQAHREAFADGRPDFSLLTMPRSITQIRRALPYLRSTMRRIVSIVDTSARLPSNVSYLKGKPSLLTISAITI